MAFTQRHGIFPMAALRPPVQALALCARFCFVPPHVPAGSDDCFGLATIARTVDDITPTAACALHGGSRTVCRACDHPSWSLESLENT